ncbi:hypothetical protein [Pedobacter deserti]|uniref:hypothetical protein n=1 Tax=Pedobacter deserti TaxID=2817382 RepID=UPI00210ED185|nr:hypothetical protein [Pedobacter sp. SYSU D00382]
MKRVLYLIGLSAILYSCGKSDTSATYVARPLTVNEKFNSSAPDSVLKIYPYKGEDAGSDGKPVYTVKFRDTLVRIQMGESDTGAIAEKFGFAEFINTQKTAMLVQVADNSGLTAPFFIVAFNDGKLDVASLYRASNGKRDKDVTKGINQIGRNGYVVNNDFFVANVNAKVYVLKRQNPEERIQGEFLTHSPDRTTLVFLTPNSLYQVNYVANETLNVPYRPEQANNIIREVQQNYTWQQQGNTSVYFFKPGQDRVVDISEFN